MNCVPEWSVYVSPLVISWARAQSKTNPKYLNDIGSIIDNVRKIADAYSKYGVVTCQLGFLLPVEKYDSYIECFTYQTKHQIHVVRIVPT